MTLFRKLYNKVQRWSSHQHAPYYLASVSFIESSIFPIPPDVMMIPMVLNKPNHAWQYALITTIASILGGILGYFIGFYAFELIGQPIIEFFNAEQTYRQIEQWFDQYGFFVMILAGVTPIPYKLFTIGAGAANMLLLPFLFGSIIGRALRFFIVAGLVKTLGKKIEPWILKYSEIIGWVVLLSILTAVCIYYFMKQ